MKEECLYIGKLAESFALGYSLIGYVAAAEDKSLLEQRNLCLKSTQQASKNLGVCVSEETEKMSNLQKFLNESEVILKIRTQINDRYGAKVSSAFEMGIWLAVAPLANIVDGHKAIEHAKEQAEKIGIDKLYSNEFFKKIKDVSDRIRFSEEVVKFISDAHKYFEEL